jgi:Na+/melibiose symporter-like transporter
VGAVPILFFIICMICLWQYPLTERRRREMREHIKRSMVQLARAESTVFGKQNGD